MAGANRGTGRRTGRNGNGRGKAKIKAKVPGWLWLVAGIAIGGFGMMLTQLAPHVGTAPDVKPTTAQKQKEPEPKGPIFDFYTLLPESEVMVPPDKKSVSKKTPATKTVIKSEPVQAKNQKPSSASQAKAGNQLQVDSGFLLQAGSFRNDQDADRLRAQLILTGFEARIEKVKVRGGEQWHRVQLGPFGSESEVRAVRQQLASQGLETMLLRQR